MDLEKIVLMIIAIIRIGILFWLLLGFILFTLKLLLVIGIIIALIYIFRRL